MPNQENIVKCKAFYVNITGQDEINNVEIESTAVTLKEVQDLLDEFKQDFPDVPLDEVIFIGQGDDSIQPITALSYNTGGEYKPSVVVHSDEVPEDQEDEA